MLTQHGLNFFYVILSPGCSYPYTTIMRIFNASPRHHNHLITEKCQAPGWSNLDSIIREIKARVPAALPPYSPNPSTQQAKTSGRLLSSLSTRIPSQKRREEAKASPRCYFMVPVPNPTTPPTATSTKPPMTKTLPSSPRHHGRAAAGAINGGP